ncbi:MAG: serine/threonine protein kinase, partial [Thioalkalivibrio sp.]|nr:serine/threonine protein kinase [Thioalkalivibrio sp.]
MKLIHGSSLKAARKSFIGSDQKTAAALVGKIARAVDYAHRGGVVHRDLKPANVLIDAAGEPHVADFGLARRFGNQRAVTVTNAIVGTPSYMAPEQAEGSAMTTTAADIYALGAILFELLAGEPPFHGGSALETLRQVIEDEPPKLSMLRADVDRDLEAIAQRCLEKRPERRYRTAAEMADDLDRFREGKPTHARPVSWVRRSAKWLRRRRQSVSVAALVVTLAGIAVGLTVSARRSADFQRRDQIKSVLQQSITQNVRLEHLESYTPAIQAGLQERLTGGDEELAALVRSLSIQIYPDLTTYGLESKPPPLHLLFANAQELIPIFSFAEVEGSWDGGPWTPLHSATCSTRMGLGAATDLVETFGRERVNEGPHRLALRANVELYDPRSFAREPSTSIIAGGGRSSWPELEQGKRLSREVRDLGEHRITLFET